MESVVLPTRLEMTVGSTEYEEVIKGFEAEKQVVFKRSKSSDSKDKLNGLQAENLELNTWKTGKDESKSTAATCRLEGKANESRPDHFIRAHGWVVQNGRCHRNRRYSSPDCVLSSFRDLSLESNKTSVASRISAEKVDIVNPSRKVRSNSTPNISGGTLEVLNKEKSQLRRRNSTSETFRSDRKPKRTCVMRGKAIYNKSRAGFANENRYGHLIHLSHEEEKIELERENHVLIKNQSTHNRRASLPSRVNTDRWSAFSPRSLTEANRTCFDADVNAKTFFPRRSSGPETCTSLKFTRMRRFSLPTSCSKTSETFPGIMRTMRNKQLSPEFPVDLGRGASLEYVLRLWNVRLSKKQTNDLKKELEYINKLKE